LTDLIQALLIEKLSKSRTGEKSQLIAWNLEVSEIKLKFTITENSIVFTRK